MMSIEIKVNGLLVAALQAANMNIKSPGECLYSYQLFEFGRKLSEEPITKVGNVAHALDDGILTLCALLLGDASGLIDASGNDEADEEAAQ